MIGKVWKSLGLTILLGFSLFLFYPSHSELGDTFVVASVYMMMKYAALFAGILLVLICLFIRRTFSITLLFIFIAMLNIAMCFSAIVLYLMHQSTREWLHSCLLNGLVGAGMVLITTLDNDKN